MDNLLFLWLTRSKIASLFSVSLPLALLPFSHLLSFSLLFSFTQNLSYDLFAIFIIIPRNYTLIKITIKIIFNNNSHVMDERRVEMNLFLNARSKLLIFKSLYIMTHLRRSFENKKFRKIVCLFFSLLF